MATRRTKTKVEVPIPSSTNGPTTRSQTRTTQIDSPPIAGSPFLPTPLEAILLSIYPGTLLLGSIFSTLHPVTRNARYQPQLQSYPPGEAPSYFAKKSNVFNQYFVKIGWFWTTLAFVLLLISHSSLGPPLKLQITKRRIQALTRYALVTIVWIAVTQWFFGPAIIDRSFKWTGGQCEIVHDTFEGEMKRQEMGDVREVVTNAACKAIGGQWAGGHDISGHVFLLILGSTMLWLELLPAVLKMEGLREARRVVTGDGLVRSASIEAEDSSSKQGKHDELGIGISAALGVAGLSWWMLLMTAAYFHTW